MQEEDKITIKRKQEYGCISKIFCFKCFKCCQADDNSILTSVKRRELSHKLITKYSQDMQMSIDQVSCLDILIILYACEEKSIAYTYLEKCKQSPTKENIQRNDLEFYIPQLLNYLVFHEDMQNVRTFILTFFFQDQLSQFILKACINNIYFSHLVHWNLYSISAVVLNNQTTEFQKVKAYIMNLVQRMVQNFDVEDQKKEPLDEKQDIIQKYGTAYFENESLKTLILPNDLKIGRYISEKRETPQYLSCINFWQDLIEVSERLKFADPKIISLRADLMKMNEQLPANIYIPFSYDEIRSHIILNIVVPETKIFSTKERAPFYICLEIFCPQSNHENTQRKSRTSQDRTNLAFQVIPDMQGQGQQGVSNDQTTKSLGVCNIFPIIKAECYEVEMQSKEQQQTSIVQSRKSAFIDLRRYEQDIFGEDSLDQQERIRQQSPFGHFESWKLVHLIIKTGDNLKQEQFALQLIDQFQQIFKIENLPLKLITYEIQSLGPTSGIMQMVKDATTIDSLKRKLSTISKDITLSQFFHLYYGEKVREAQINFCRSLAAYCLVCYFLQIKDRHNGNILLHKSGLILHIDFGFFLSIAPGKGLEFEKNVPFKLLTEYLDVIDGTESQLFDTFRKLFFKGFQACQKHQDKILLLVKMMYSGHGYTLPCFSKGESAIKDLEKRFNPQYHNDGELSVFTQELINQSLDNWRARWYDKFQYYFQGIFY